MVLARALAAFSLVLLVSSTLPGSAAFADRRARSNDTSVTAAPATARAKISRRTSRLRAAKWAAIGVAAAGAIVAGNAALAANQNYADARITAEYQDSIVVTDADTANMVERYGEVAKAYEKVGDQAMTVAKVGGGVTALGVAAAAAAAVPVRLRRLLSE